MPPVIRLLPPNLANQIAAGEVIERPASVVKELVENAIDAGARRITISTELGGKAAIRVEDDGVGMAPEDARLALERHATSKIATAEDLASIDTLGFRGEALPSIASVSRFTLRTRLHGATSGTEIRVEGGTILGEKEIGAPEGTRIDVNELFFNLPARRKFLKSDAAESAQISRLVTQFALGYPEIGFTLTSGGRKLLQCPPSAQTGSAAIRDRFYQIFGERSDLVELRKEAAGIRVTGYVAKLTDQGPVRGQQNIFVNRRIVKDRTIAHAITDAYSQATIKERSPEVHLFFEMAPDRVDVNVHPTKAEVRFLEGSLVHEVLRRGLLETLGQGKPPELQLSPVAGFAPASFGGGSSGGEFARPAILPNVFLETLPPRSNWRPSPPGQGPWPTPGGWPSDLARATAGSSGAGAPGDANGVRGAGGEGGAGEMTAADIAVALASGAALSLPQPGLMERQITVDPNQPLIPLGQFRDTFIIAIDGEGISIIDQHVAHERILFEQIMARLTDGPLESQRLLEPVLIELSIGQRQALALHQEQLARLGFEVVEFGGDSLRIAAVPPLLRFEEAAASVRALAEDLEGLDRGARVDEALRRIAALMACHAAVKANDPLTLEKMQYLLAELRRTSYSTVCPHGRPVLLRLTRREIERNFQRA
jgi:DNA mismatch repair protein MutL